MKKITPFKMNGWSGYVNSPAKQKRSPIKGWKAPEELFPGTPPEFVVKLGWGEGEGFGTGLSTGTWKYLGNRAYKWGTGGIRKYGEELGDFAKGIGGNVKSYLKGLRFRRR
jgi:hypothetical protein